MIRYFGYGANASEDMMQAIIGRKPTGTPALLRNYQLWIQHFKEIPPGVRKKLIHWNKDFKTYCIRPYRNAAVKGMIWLLTREERRLVNNWEFWYKPIRVKIRSAKKMIFAETEMIPSKTVDLVIASSDHYPLFLNTKKRMLDAARKERLKFLQANS
jgi:hypothetical protein